MKKITAKYITENLTALTCGQHIHYRGAEFWARENTIYYINADRKLSGAINGHIYGHIVDGVAYHAED